MALNTGMHSLMATYSIMLCCILTVIATCYSSKHGACRLSIANRFDYTVLKLFFSSLTLNSVYVAIDRWCRHIAYDTVYMRRHILILLKYLPALNFMHTYHWLHKNIPVLYKLLWPLHHPTHCPDRSNSMCCSQADTAPHVCNPNWCIPHHT